MVSDQPGSGRDVFLVWLATEARPWKSGPRRYPKMPRSTWWPATVALFTVGTTIGLIVFGTSGPGVLRAIASGIAVFLVGMYLVESRWLRRQTARGPIEQ